jgi:ABC-2 type transport system permease protein
MNLRKILLIARREFTYNVRRRSYLFTAFFLPFLSIGLSLLATQISNSSVDDRGSFQRVGIVDQAGLFKAAPAAPYELITLEKAQAEIAAGTLPVYYILPADYLTTRKATSYSIASLPLGLNRDVTRVVRIALSEQVGRADVTTRLQTVTEKIVIRQPGTTRELPTAVLFVAFIGPFIFGMLLFVSIMTTSQFLLSGVAEEKENRMMELLTTSTRPAEMLWGKLIGLGGLGIAQLLIWALVGLVFALTQGTENLSIALAALQVTPGYVLLFVVYFLLGYLFNGALMAGVGASVSLESEGRQFAGILSFVYVLPFVFLFNFITDPNGPTSTFLSLFPFTSPLAMVLRVAFGDVPPEQIALSIGILLASVALIIWVAGRVFRVGMLAYGKRLGLRDIWRALRESSPVITQKEATS